MYGNGSHCDSCWKPAADCRCGTRGDAWSSLEGKSLEELKALRAHIDRLISSREWDTSKPGNW